MQSMVHVTLASLVIMVTCATHLVHKTVNAGNVTNQPVLVQMVATISLRERPVRKKFQEVSQ